jgi:GNAT superfamily N-acetyltransferase
MQRTRETQHAYHLSQGIYFEEYFPAARREEQNEKQNKQIYNLAKRNKFYAKKIGQMLEVLDTFGFYAGSPYFMHLAKKATKGGSIVVGFIAFTADTLRADERMLTTLQYLFVHPKFQEKGVGTELYQRMLRTSESYGIANQAVEFDATNPRLCELYTRAGYAYLPKYDGKVNKEDGTHVKWYKITVKKYASPFNLTLVDDEPEAVGAQVPHFRQIRAAILASN